MKCIDFTRFHREVPGAPYPNLWGVQKKHGYSHERYLSCTIKLDVHPTYMSHIPMKSYEYVGSYTRANHYSVPKWHAPPPSTCFQRCSAKMIWDFFGQNGNLYNQPKWGFGEEWWFNQKLGLPWPSFWETEQNVQNVSGGLLNHGVTLKSSRHGWPWLGIG